MSFMFYGTLFQSCTEATQNGFNVVKKTPME